MTTPELERCYKEVTGIEGFIIKTDIDPEIVKKSVELNIPLDCMWKVTAEEGSKVRMMYIITINTLGTLEVWQF